MILPWDSSKYNKTWQYHQEERTLKADTDTTLLDLDWVSRISKRNGKRERKQKSRRRRKEEEKR